MAEDVVQEVVNKIRVDDGTQKAFNNISNNFDKNSKKANKFEENLRQAFSYVGGQLMTQAITGIGMAMREAVVDTLQFKEAMAEVSTLVDTTTVNMGEMEAQVRDMAISFGKSGTEISKGFYQAISAGVNDADITGFMETANMLAVGGVASTEQSVDLLTTVINAYGMSVDKAETISNKLFQTVKEGKTNISQLAGSMGQVIPIASQAGVSIDEVLAATAALTKQGVSTTESVTLLKGLLTAVIQPAEKSQKAIKQLGLEMFSVDAIKDKGLLAFLKELRDETGGNITTMAKLIPNIRGLSGASALAGTNFDVMAEILGRVQEDANQARIAYNKMAEDMSNKAKIIKTGFDEATISFVDGLMQGIADNSGTTKQLSEDMKSIADTAKTLGELTFKTGSGILGFLEKIDGYIPVIIAARYGIEKLSAKMLTSGVNDVSLEDLDKQARARGVVDRINQEKNGLSTDEQYRQDWINDAKAEEQKRSQNRAKEKQDIIAIDDYLGKMTKMEKEVTKEVEKQNKLREKQRQTMAEQIALMGEVERAQTLELGKFLSGASRSELEGLNQFQREAIKGNKFLSKAFQQASERTGLTSELQASIEESLKPIIETVLVAGTNRMFDTAEKRLTGKAVDNIQEKASVEGNAEMIAGG